MDFDLGAALGEGGKSGKRDPQKSIEENILLKEMQKRAEED